MVIGGTIIPSSNVEQFNRTMQKYRTEQKMFSELKWSKVTNQKLAEYKRFVEYFFALNNTDNCNYSAYFHPVPLRAGKIRQFATEYHL
jgi:hypothetical protein